MTDSAVRLSKLRSALTKTVKSCISSVSYDLLKAHFNPTNREDKKILHDIHTQFQEKALALIKEEIDLMIREENIEKLLYKLEELCKLSTGQWGSTLWRPRSIPYDDVAAHLLPGLVTLRHKLKVLLGDMDAETDRLMRAVQERHRLIQSLKTEIAQNEKQLWQSAEQLNQGQINHLVGPTHSTAPWPTRTRGAESGAETGKLKVSSEGVCTPPPQPTTASGGAS